MEILIVNSAEPDIREFVIPLENISKKYGTNYRTIEYNQLQDTDLNYFHGIILSGSPCGDDIVEHHLPFYQWLIKHEKPVLGICAGHHISGTLWGCELYRGKEMEIGDYQIFIDHHDELFKGMDSPFVARLMHHDSISLPDEFHLLAHSEKCGVEAMKHKENPIYTLQFHPEFLNHQLILNFLNICKNQNFR